MNPRVPPSGVFAAMGRFSLSAPAAYLAGVAFLIPFDRTDFVIGEGISLDAANKRVTISPGLYFAQVQYHLTAAPTLLTSALDIFSLAAIDEGGIVQPTSNAATLACNALRLPSETPISATVFAAVAAGFTGTVNAGNVDVASLLVYRLADPPI